MISVFIFVLIVGMGVCGAVFEKRKIIVEPAYFCGFGWVCGFISGLSFLFL